MDQKGTDIVELPLETGPELLSYLNSPAEAPSESLEIPPITLYENREYRNRVNLSRKEKKDFKRITAQIFKKIEENHESDESFEGMDEITLAEEIQCRRILDETLEETELLREKLTDPHLGDKTRGQIEENEKRAATLTNRTQPLRSLKTLEDLKVKFLKYKMAERLNGPQGESLKASIEELILSIQTERKRQKAEPLFYSENALKVLVYERVYDDYLWRDIKRKKGNELYSRAHLGEAAKDYVKGGFTGLAGILSILKHDHLEDLALHKKGYTNQKPDGSKNEEFDYKEDWLFCEKLYENELNSEARDQKEEVLTKASETIHGMTSPPPRTSYGRRKNLSKDDDRLIAYLEHLLQTPYPGRGKVIEQISNARSIRGLSENRQAEKLNQILILHGMMAKVLQLKDAEYGILGAGIDFYRPDIRTRYLEDQHACISKRMGLETAPGNIDHLLGRLLGVTLPVGRLKGKMAEALSPRKNTIEGVQSETQGRVLDALRLGFHPNANILNIQIVPTPLEHYVKVEELVEKGPKYLMDVPDDDPRFEILILVRHAEDIQRIAGEIEGKIGYDGETISKPLQGGKGVLKIITNNRLGGKFHVRVNSVDEEMLAKRGVAADRKTALPKNLKDRIEATLKEIRETTERSPLEIAREILLRKEIIAFTDETKIEPVTLTEGSSFLDFCAQLHSDQAIDALEFGISALVRRSANQKKHRMFDEIEEGDRCLIQKGKKEEGSKLEIGHLVFAREAKTKNLAKKIFKDRYPKKGQKAAIEAKRAAIERAKTYLIKLSHLFGINEANILSISNEMLGEMGNDEDTLTRIGNVDLNPLKGLAEYVDKNKSCNVNFHIVQDQEGIWNQITQEFKKLGISIEQLTQENTENEIILRTKFRLPEKLNPYQFLKLMLKFSYIYETHLDPEIFNFPET